MIPGDTVIYQQQYIHPTSNTIAYRAAQGTVDEILINGFIMVNVEGDLQVDGKVLHITGVELMHVSRVRVESVNTP